MSNDIAGDQRRAIKDYNQRLDEVIAERDAWRAEVAKLRQACEGERTKVECLTFANQSLREQGRATEAGLITARHAIESLLEAFHDVDPSRFSQSQNSAIRFARMLLKDRSEARAPGYIEYSDPSDGRLARIEFRDGAGHRLGVFELPNLPGRCEVFRDCCGRRDAFYVTDPTTMRHFAKALLAMAGALAPVTAGEGGGV